MKRTFFTAILFTVTLLFLAGCSSTKLADAFDAETVETMAREAADHLIAGEYDENIAMMSDVMKNALSAEILAENMDTMNEQTGSFVEYKSTAVVGQKDKDGRDLATAVIVAAFEKRNVTYTITFNTDMEVDGLFMK